MKDSSPVARAFSKQSSHFDEEDLSNPILQAWRKQVYAHVESFITPQGRILELNAGTGIDAFYFAGRGHQVHATDLSEGMISAIERKISETGAGEITFQQMSFEDLGALHDCRFDFAFSNFGGLNCIQDLSRVAGQLPGILHDGAYVSWVIMPPACPWEWLWLAKGKWNDAVRRFSRSGSRAHLEGEYFQTYYHSLSAVKKALGSSFRLVRTESLGLLKPPPSATKFYRRYKTLSSFLQRVDSIFKDVFPFNRWGDHIIVTFRKFADDGGKKN